jgi:AcrR family transcriptional regulator
MRKRSARAPEETRKNLITAAAKLFNTAGYFSTDSNRIAREAGYAPGTFYVHFADKLAIFLEVYRWWADLEWQVIISALSRSASRPSQNTRIAKAVLQHHREWRIFRSSLRALTATDERVHEARIKQRQRQIGQIADLLRSRGVHQTAPRIYGS